MNSVTVTSVVREHMHVVSFDNRSFFVDPFVNETFSFDNNRRRYNDLIYRKRRRNCLHIPLDDCKERRARERERKIDLAYVSTRSP